MLTSATSRSSLNGSHLMLLVVGLVGVSMSGPIMAGAVAVPPLAIALWRTGLGAIAIGPFTLARHRHELAELAHRDYARCLFAGLMLAAHFATWTTSLRYTSVASATALVCLQVAWVVLLARLAGDTVSPGVVLGCGVALLGVLVVSGVDVTVSGRALTGDLLAILGGMFGAVYVVVGSRVRETVSTTVYTSLCYGVCALVTLVAALAAGVQLVGFDAKSWALIGAVTVMSQLLGHSVFNHLLAVISPTVVSLVLLLEVPGAALLAAVFLGQAPPVAVYAGVAVICAGLALVVRARSRTPVEAPVD